ncbi:alpha/beta hydrolase [Nitrosomonas cryotolerans]|nr:alpha/beta hydrolase [Nitrosomonas cryotolerans]
MLFNWVIVVILIYLLLVLLLFLGQSRLIFFPETGRKIIATPGQVGLVYESVRINTVDNEMLHGWFVPASGAKATVLFFHGNAGNISHRIGYLSMFNQLDYNLLIFDYRGYGQSSGTPTESGTYLDALAAWRYLIEVKGISPSRIILFGESLGGAVAAWLAAHKAPGMLVLASVFTSVPDMAEEIYPFFPVRRIARFNYDTVESLRSVTCPVLIVHSLQDEIVPFKHGQSLYQMAFEPKQFLTLQGGHNDGFIFMQESWIRSFENFVTENLIIQSP